MLEGFGQEQIRLGKALKEVMEISAKQQSELEKMQDERAQNQNQLEELMVSSRQLASQVESMAQEKQEASAGMRLVKKLAASEIRRLQSANESLRKLAKELSDEAEMNHLYMLAAQEEKQMLQGHYLAQLTGLQQELVFHYQRAEAAEKRLLKLSAKKASPVIQPKNKEKIQRAEGTGEEGK